MVEEIWPSGREKGIDFFLGPPLRIVRGRTLIIWGGGRGAKRKKYSVEIYQDMQIEEVIEEADLIICYECKNSCTI